MMVKVYECGLSRMPIDADVLRLHGHDTDAGTYLITLHVAVESARKDYGYITCYPQARAVMDDFGDLRLTRNWQ